MNSKSKKICFIALVTIFYFSNSYAQGPSVFDIARSGSLSDLKQIIKKDKNIINSISQEGYSALTLACYYNNNDVATYLIKNVEDINSKSSYGTPLMAASVKKK